MKCVTRSLELGQNSLLMLIDNDSPRTSFQVLWNSRGWKGSCNRENWPDSLIYQDYCGYCFAQFDVQEVQLHSHFLRGGVIDGALNLRYMTCQGWSN